MAAKEFIVKLVADDYAQWALALDQVQPLIVDAIGYRGTVIVDSVVEFNREDYALVRTAKTPAIKRIREILQCSLLEAKMIVDAAEKRTGTTNAFGVIVSYDPSFHPDGFHVKKA